MIVPTSSIYHDVVIDSDEAAERLLEALEQSKAQASIPAYPDLVPIKCFDKYRLSPYNGLAGDLKNEGR